MKTTNLEQKRAFMCEGGYPVVHPLDSHPKGCNVAAIEGKNIELFGTHNHGETWELKGYWAWDDRFNDHFIIWLDKMVEFVESQLVEVLQLDYRGE